ncbi:hypothetical protein J6590_082099 [Homalodisca vitripennis]|nr:hypothetical protein J6590_082099 [Homalodisca vitripennis]
MGDEIKSDAIHDLLFDSESESDYDFDTHLGPNIDFMNDLNENAGNYVRDDVVSSTIQLISETQSQQTYMVQQLWQALEQDTADRQPLTQVATWCIGEYGDSLLYTPDSAVKVTEAEVIKVYQRLLWSPQNSVITKQYALLSLTKLSTRFNCQTEGRSYKSVPETAVVTPELCYNKAVCLALTDQAQYSFQVTEAEVIKVYQRLLWSPQNSVITKHMLLSLTKLSTRFNCQTEGRSYKSVPETAVVTPELCYNKAVTEAEVIKVYQRLLWSPQNSVITKQYALLSLTKLSTRFNCQTDKIQEVVEAFGSHVHMELQQRGVEFTQLFGKYNHLRRPLLERMPAMEVSRTHTSETNGEMEGEVLPDTTQPPDTQAQDSNALLVLLGGDTGEGDIVRPVETSKSTDNQDLLDLLGLDIGTTIPSTNSNSNGLPNNNNNNILLDSTLLDTTPSTVSELVAYEKNGLRLLFTLERLGETPSTNVIHCTLFHPVVAVSELVAYEKNGLRLLFTLERLGETPSTTVIHCTLFHPVVAVSELVAYEKNGLRLLFTLERLGETPSTTVIHCTLFHPVVAVSELVAYEKNGLRLLFTLERLGETPSTTVIHCTLFHPVVAVSELVAYEKNVSELVAYEKNGLRLLFTLERLGETPSTTVIHCTLFHPVVAVSELVAYEKNGLRLLFTLERLGDPLHDCDPLYSISSCCCSV